MAVGFFFKRREFVFSMDINSGSIFEIPSTGSDLSCHCRSTTEDRGGAGWNTQPNKPKLIGHFGKRDCTIPGTAQNRGRIKMAPLFLRQTWPAPDPILLAEDALLEETGSRRGAEAVRPRRSRAATDGLRFDACILGEASESGRERRIG
jgi:hypothetical protein